jgi:hypothetical protein
MKQRPNPIQKTGDRNLFCANYGDCLDHAAKRHWKYWSCYHCKHQYRSQPSVDGPITANETALFYTMPQDIYQKVI